MPNVRLSREAKAKNIFIFVFAGLADYFKWHVLVLSLTSVHHILLHLRTEIKMKFHKEISVYVSIVLF